MDGSADKELTQLKEQLQKTNPMWIKAVEAGRSKQADFVMLTLSAFTGEPKWLYDALRYASLNGVSVQIVPEK